MDPHVTIRDISSSLGATGLSPITGFARHGYSLHHYSQEQQLLQPLPQALLTLCKSTLAATLY